MRFLTHHRFTLILLFACTLFVSASLVFVLQPLFGKLLLPLLGGSPAVWNTCMVFYQSILFLGYLYAHTSSLRLTPVRQLQLHSVLVLLSMLTLPLALPENSAPPTDSNPTLWLLWTLLSSIGLPFFVVSSTAPLMQKWFAQVGHSASQDPYFLYTASNLGSLLALLSYPLLIEPAINLDAQQLSWSIAYGVLAILLSLCGGVFLTKVAKKSDNLTEQFVNVPALSVFTQLHWLVLAFVPSSLLLGLTNFISTDIASVPLLWIVPLTVYLLSFIIVFAKFYDRIHGLVVAAQTIFLVIFIIYAFINPAELPYWMYLILHVVAFFLAALVCHGELAKRRPPTYHLTRFYLLMSLAGMLGGMFNTFVAPFIFNDIYEYPLMIMAALLLRPDPLHSFFKRVGIQLLPALALLCLGVLLHSTVTNLVTYFDELALSLMGLTLLGLVLRKRPLSFATTYGVIIFLALGLHNLSSQVLYQERSFFGVLSMRSSTLINEQQQSEQYHELFHGTTKHGAERLSPQHLKTPLTYYSQPGPMGQLFSEYANQNANWTVGVVGLGAGALACYAKPTQHWVFYEIDPLVVSVANNTNYFNYLDQCAKDAKMVIGDARLSLTHEPEGLYDLLVMDAFSSDAVPTHLLTEEALNLYFKKLKPTGILAFHITNRHLLLKKVLSIHAEKAHFSALIQEFIPNNNSPLVVATDWLVMARTAEQLAPLKNSQLGQWNKLPLYFDMQPWTDHYSNIVSIWK
jgi:spermidine synthase